MASPTGRRESAKVVDRLALWQVLSGVLLLLAWELFARAGGSTWISRPTLIGAKLLGWISGDLYLHVGTTVTEMLIGLAIGTSLGAVIGILLGQSKVLGIVLRPIVVALYSIPMVSLAPLFIMFFGIDLLPKIVLVSIVVFFLIFFTTFAGAAAVDRDFIAALQLMGADRREIFSKILIPGSLAWIVAGLKIAIPYSLVAATTGEMLASRRGLGFLLSDAAARFDMASLYAALFILMVIGLLVAESASFLERLAPKERNSNDRA